MQPGEPVMLSLNVLDHPEHDGADKGHGEVRGDNAQSPDERHDVAPWIALGIAPSARAALRATLMVNRELPS